MVGYFFVGDAEHQAAAQVAFFQQKRCQAPVEAFPHYLLHQPHNVGEAAGYQLICIACHGQTFFHQIFEQAGGQNGQLAVFFCLDDNVKLHVGHNAGRRKQAYIPLEQAIQGDLSALTGQCVHTHLTRVYEQQTQAFAATVVEHFACLGAHGI